jgi:hypothetical protein
MAVLGYGFYRCPYCGAPVEGVPLAEQPDITLITDEHSGSFAWILLFHGRQLHRCSDADADLELSEHVHQAICLIARRAGCGRRGALDRLRVMAASSHQTLELAALDILDGVLHIDC